MENQASDVELINMIRKLFKCSEESAISFFTGDRNILLTMIKLAQDDHEGLFKDWNLVSNLLTTPTPCFNHQCLTSLAADVSFQSTNSFENLFIPSTSEVENRSVFHSSTQEDETYFPPSTPMPESSSIQAKTQDLSSPSCTSIFEHLSFPSTPMEADPSFCHLQTQNFPPVPSTSNHEHVSFPFNAMADILPSLHSQARDICYPLMPEASSFQTEVQDLSFASNTTNVEQSVFPSTTITENSCNHLQTQVLRPLPSISNFNKTKFLSIPVTCSIFHSQTQNLSSPSSTSNLDHSLNSSAPVSENPSISLPQNQNPPSSSNVEYSLVTTSLISEMFSVLHSQARNASSTPNTSNVNSFSFSSHPQNLSFLSNSSKVEYCLVPSKILADTLSFIHSQIQKFSFPTSISNDNPNLFISNPVSENPTLFISQTENVPVHPEHRDEHSSIPFKPTAANPSISHSQTQRVPTQSTLMATNPQFVHSQAQQIPLASSTSNSANSLKPSFILLNSQTQNLPLSSTTVNVELPIAIVVSPVVKPVPQPICVILPSTTKLDGYLLISTEEPQAQISNSAVCNNSSDINKKAKTSSSRRQDSSANQNQHRLETSLPTVCSVGSTTISTNMKSGAAKKTDGSCNRKRNNRATTTTKIR